MPTDANGVYTPLNNYQSSLAQTYIGRLLRAGQHADQNTIDKALRKVQGDVSDTNSIVGAMLAAVGANDSARTMRRTHNRTPLPSEHANISGDAARRGQYAYTVLVSATDPRTGAVSHSQTLIYSPTPMSLDRLRQNVEANRTYYIRRTGSPPVRDNDVSGYGLDTAILSAGIIR